MMMIEAARTPHCMYDCYHQLYRLNGLINALRYQDDT